MLFAPFQSNDDIKSIWRRKELVLGALTQSVDVVQNMKFSCLQCEVVTDCTERFSLLLTQSVEVTLRAVPGAVLCQKSPKGDSALAYLCLR